MVQIELFRKKRFMTQNEYGTDSDLNETHSSPPKLLRWNAYAPDISKWDALGSITTKLSPGTKP